MPWYDSRDGYHEIYFARLGASGNKIGSDVRVTNDAAASDDQSLVWTGSAYGVSWADYRDGNWEIYFARLDAEGDKIDADQRLTFDEQRSWYPDVAWNGAEYAIAWVHGFEGDAEDGIRVARLDPAGAPIGTPTHVSAPFLWYPVLAWNGWNYAITWQVGATAEIYFARVGCCEDGDPGEPGCQWIPGPSYVDFGPSTSTPAVGYVGDGGRPFDPSRGYGWLIAAGTSVASRTRSCASTSETQKGFVFSSSLQTWEMEVCFRKYLSSFTE